MLEVQIWKKYFSNFHVIMSRIYDIAFQCFTLFWLFRKNVRLNIACLDCLVMDWRRQLRHNNVSTKCSQNFLKQTCSKKWMIRQMFWLKFTYNASYAFAFLWDCVSTSSQLPIFDREFVLLLLFILNNRKIQNSLYHWHKD